MKGHLEEEFHRTNNIAEAISGWGMNMNNGDKQPKAAIMTWCYNNGKTNYGQILQCYAMQVLVRKLGYETKIIRYRRRDSDEETYRDGSSDLYIDLYELSYRLEKVENRASIRILRFIHFIHENICLSKQCYTKEQVENECKDCSALFCGSDQIWNPIWFDDIYALNFGMPHQKRIAYAPSGVLVENEQTKQVYRDLGRMLNRFDIITVREKNSIEILKKYTKKDIIDVLDPTLLLDKDEWNKVAAGKIEKEPYIFCYSLGKLRTHKVVLNEVMKKHKAKKVLFLTSEHYENENVLERGGNYYSVEDSGPAEFIALIRDAQAVCTDSFHGLALSIVYQKQFYIFERDELQANTSANILRQKNLLCKIGIEEDRLVKCAKEVRFIDNVEYAKISFDQYFKQLKLLIEKN